MPSRMLAPGVAAAPEIADRCKPLGDCDILPQQAESPVEIFPVCSKICSIKENAPSDFIPVSGAITRIAHASRRVSARAAKLQASSWFIPGKAGITKNRTTAAWLDDATGAQKWKRRLSMSGAHLSMHRSNLARWFVHARAAVRHHPPATLTFGNPGVTRRQITARNS